MQSKIHVRAQYNLLLNSMRMDSIIGAIVIFVCFVQTQSKYGRHICMTERRVTRPLPVRQSYYRPVYTQEIRICEGNKKCTKYRLKYQTAYRTIFHYAVRTEVVPGCCPGWTQTSPRDSGCMQPLCPGGCKNGGTCISPGRCRCMKGWAGRHCNMDFNECSSESARCQQKCENTPGSYKCSCHDGFLLKDDGKSCKFCLSCTDEFQEMHKEYKTLEKRVFRLEKEKDILMKNMTALEQDYGQALHIVHTVKDLMRTTTTPEPRTVPPFSPTFPTQLYQAFTISANDRIESLSEQISMLEERMTVCTCKDGDY